MAFRPPVGAMDDRYISGACSGNDYREVWWRGAPRGSAGPGRLRGRRVGAGAVKVGSLRLELGLEYWR